jgi:hypothetical protein
MATIPAGTRFIGISTTADLAERKSTIQNSLTEPYTIEDLIDGTDFTVLDITSTSAPSKSTLNTTYPIADYPIGTKVVCAEVTGGAVANLRVSADTWFKFAVTKVS